MRTIIIILFFLTTAAAGAQQIYRSVDKQGNVIFTDEPTEGAEKIELNETTTIKSLEVVPAAPTTPELVKKELSYGSLSIISPQNDESIRDNAGNVSVSVAIEPILFEGHEVVIYLDGMEKMAGVATAFNLENIDRGTHQIRVSIRDPNGRILISSKSTTFHLHRQSVLH